MVLFLYLINGINHCRWSSCKPASLRSIDRSS